MSKPNPKEVEMLAGWEHSAGDKHLSDDARKDAKAMLQHEIQKIAKEHQNDPEYMTALKKELADYNAKHNKKADGSHSSLDIGTDKSGKLVGIEIGHKEHDFGKWVQPGQEKMFDEHHKAFQKQDNAELASESRAREAHHEREQERHAREQERHREAEQKKAIEQHLAADRALDPSVLSVRTQLENGGDPAKALEEFGRHLQNLDAAGRLAAAKQLENAIEHDPQLKDKYAVRVNEKTFAGGGQFDLIDKTAHHSTSLSLETFAVSQGYGL